MSLIARPGEELLSLTKIGKQQLTLNMEFRIIQRIAGFQMSENIKAKVLRHHHSHCRSAGWN